MFNQTAFLGGLLLAAGASAQTTFDFAAPTFDRWNYPFNFTAGVRPAASTFSSGFVPDQFDDRDAQFLNSFITGGAIAPGQGASNYIITSATEEHIIVANNHTRTDVDDQHDSFLLRRHGRRGVCPKVCGGQ